MKASEITKQRLKILKNNIRISINHLVANPMRFDFCYKALQKCMEDAEKLESEIQSQKKEWQREGYEGCLEMIEQMTEKGFDEWYNQQNKEDES